MNELSVIIVEKDPQDTNSLNSLLSGNCPSIHISGIANNAKDACEILLSNTFDLVFLDVDIEAENVSDLLKTVSGHLLNKGLIVLSQHTGHAFESFKYSAIDYILKPLVLSDIFKALHKAGKLKEEGAAKQEEAFLGMPVTIVAIPSLTEVKILRVSNIVYLQSDGRYTIFYTTHENTIVSSKNLGYYEKLLMMNKNFFRIHHSYLVNIDLALNVYKKDGVYLEIYNKKYLPISKRKTDAFYKFLGI